MALLSDILYASWNGAAWKTQTVVSGIHLDLTTSLVLDSYDYPHISYISAEGLMYAGWTGAAWNIQTVDSNAYRGPSYLVVDSNRIPHISYRSGSSSGITNLIRYAVVTEPVPLSSPPSPALPLLLVLTAVIIGAVVTAVYVWKKKTQSLSK
jgi:hypothetical protein